MVKGRLEKEESMKILPVLSEGHVHCFLNYVLHFLNCAADTFNLPIHFSFLLNET